MFFPIQILGNKKLINTAIYFVPISSGLRIVPVVQSGSWEHCVRSEHRVGQLKTMDSLSNPALCVGFDDVKYYNVLYIISVG